jgi:hypothetical protein
VKLQILAIAKLARTQRLVPTIRLPIIIQQLLLSART